MYISSDGSTMKGAEEEYGCWIHIMSFNETEGEICIYLGLLKLSFLFLKARISTLKIWFYKNQTSQKTLIQSDTKPIKCKLIGWTHFATIKTTERQQLKKRNFET